MTIKPDGADFARDLDRVLGDLRKMLIEKNTAYGNSALEPVRIFSKADDVEQLKVRLDDKLSRIAKGNGAGENPAWDALGYLVILEIAERRRRRVRVPAIAVAAE